jgi:NAD-dependent oxidoreductase involved in siderophore biosynthesis
VPELFAHKEYDFLVGKAGYIKNVSSYVWTVVRQSAAASDSVLQIEKLLTEQVRPDYKYSYENRNGIIVKQYSTYFTQQYQDKLNGMVERRMRQSIHATASIWYTAWVNAGQPDLQSLVGKSFSPEELEEWNVLNNDWKSSAIKGRSCEN